MTSYDNERIVLIREEHFGWQTMRYESGNNHWNKPEFGPPEDIAEVLWKRLRGGGE